MIHFQEAVPITVIRPCVGMTCQRFLIKALPQECRQVGNVVGMKVAHRNQRQVAYFRLGLAKPAQSAATHIDEHSGLISDPEEIAR